MILRKRIPEMTLKLITAAALVLSLSWAIAVGKRKTLQLKKIRLMFSLIQLFI